ncbi:MAG: hypothetical protein QW063_01630 [Candidatus Nanoarchaeia archaeon]
MAFDPKTWGWIKVVGGAIAFWWAWKAGIGMNVTGSVAILAILAFLGGLKLAMGKK